MTGAAVLEEGLDRLLQVLGREQLGRLGPDRLVGGGDAAFAEAAQDVRSVSSALKSSPVITNWRARPEPARSASRWVSPIDGVSPTTFSTRPNFACGEATIRSQASAISKAAVRVIAWAAKTIGGGQSLEPIDRPQQLIPKPAALGRGQPIEDVDVSAGRGGPALGPDQDCVRRLGDEVLDRGLEVVDHPPSKRFSGGLSRVRTVSPSSYSTLTAFSPAAIAAAY